MIKHTVMALIACLLLFSLVSCTVPEPFEQGEVLTADEVEAKRDALRKEKDEQANKPYDGMCYWLAGGKVYHISPDCSYIRNKENVLSGTKDEALGAGKEQVCSVCGK